jgi:nucleosome binding factor SPN SPT16 subunit
MLVCWSIHSTKNTGRKNQVTYYERKMAESLQRYNDSIDAGDTQKQAEHMREYLNYERMSKMIKG